MLKFAQRRKMKNLRVGPDIPSSNFGLFFLSSLPSYGEVYWEENSLKYFAFNFSNCVVQLGTRLLGYTRYFFLLFKYRTSWSFFINSQHSRGWDWLLDTSFTISRVLADLEIFQKTPFTKFNCQLSFLIIELAQCSWTQGFSNLMLKNRHLTLPKSHISCTNF